MPVTAIQGTKLVCEATDWSISNLHLQRTLFLAHMSILQRTEGRHGIIVGEPFLASDFGPIVPKVFDELGMFGARPVRNIFRWVNVNKIDYKEATFLKSFALKFADVAPARMLYATHRPKGAWSRCYQVGRNVGIPNRLIFEEAQALYEKAHA